MGYEKLRDGKGKAGGTRGDRMQSVQSVSGIRENSRDMCKDL